MTRPNELRPVSFRDDRLCLLDQRCLPGEERWRMLETAGEVAAAIADMTVRGAPAIGCAAGYGLALAARAASDVPAAFVQALAAAAGQLKAVRPTAVNLAWAVDRVHRAASAALAISVEAARNAALAEAEAITAEDLESCRRIGRNGLEVVPASARFLTHCNAGALATAGYGTALGVIRAAAAAGRLERVYADETRPRQQGARLTAWELHHDGLPVTVIADTVAGLLMARRAVDLVVVGADRIARNGDTANKIGTYGLAILAAYHDIPFYVAAPTSTVDLATSEGRDIPIEERDPEEVAIIDGRRVVPEGVPCYNPAFDVTPAALIRGIITERGLARPPYDVSLAQSVTVERGAVNRA